MTSRNDLSVSLRCKNGCATATVPAGFRDIFFCHVCARVMNSQMVKTFGKARHAKDQLKTT